MVKFYLQQRLSHQNYFVKSRLYLWCTTDFECVLTKMLPSLPYSEFHCHPIKTESSSSQPCHIHTSRTAASARHNFERKDRHPGQKRCPGADSEVSTAVRISQQYRIIAHAITCISSVKSLRLQNRVCADIKQTKIYLPCYIFTSINVQ